jgi:hypothetical protein
MTTGHVVEIVGGTSPSAARAFFCVPLLSSDDGARQLPKKSQKEHPKEQQARASMVACEQEPCKHHAKHARLHGSCAYATGLPRAMLLLCTYQVRAPAHHLPSRWSQSVRTTRLSGHLENFPILFFIGSLCPRGKESLQFCFVGWLCPRGKRVYNFCFVGSAPEGREFTILFYCLCPEIRDFTIMFYYCLCPEGRDCTIMFCYCLCPKGKRLYNFVLLLSLPEREETLQFCSIGSAQREETSQFCFIDSAQRKQNFNILFY